MAPIWPGPESDRPLRSEEKFVRLRPVGANGARPNSEVAPPLITSRRDDLKSGYSFSATRPLPIPR
jgi:hypothetical protein